MKKILVSDYDDTLYIDDNGIKQNLIAIDEFKNQGNLFVIATGRSYQDFKTKQNKYNIECDYLIINHGTTILKNDEIIFNQIIENEIIKNIKNDLNLVDNDNLFCCSKKMSRVSIDSNDITKIHIAFDSKELAKKSKELLDKKYGEYINCYYISAKTAIEIVSNKINKAVAIKKILELENTDEVYVIGNGSSDIEMIEEFNGCAVKGSIDEVLKISKKVYSSVAELVEVILSETND